jgi:hypothetical protein
VRPSPATCATPGSTWPASTGCARLDKKSSSAHKFSKRLWRACLIAEAFVAELQRSGELDERTKNATTYFPALRDLLVLRTPGAVVLMRMCEQLIESYELTANEKLRADAGVVMEAMGKPLRRIVSAPLTDKTFLELMEVFAHVGKSIYHHQFVLTENRRHLVSDEALSTLAQTVRDAILRMFQEGEVPCRCAVVENFAIVADPDLPAELKESLPLDFISLVVYTNTAGAELLPQIERVVTPLVRPESREVPPPAMDVVRHGKNVYVRLTEPVTDPLFPSEPGPALLMTIQGVDDDSRANWVAPGHVHDLNGIIAHYRRTLSTYSEFYVQGQKKRILQELEIALTTY